MRFGFRNGHGFYGIDVVQSGIWLSEYPLSSDEGAHGDTVLRIITPLNPQLFRHYERIEPGKPYREWCVPAKIVNHLGKIVVLPPTMADNLALDAQTRNLNFLRQQ